MITFRLPGKMDRAALYKDGPAIRFRCLRQLSQPMAPKPLTTE